MVFFADRKRRRELRPVIALAALDLGKFANERPAAAVQVVVRTYAPGCRPIQQPPAGLESGP